MFRLHHSTTFVFQRSHAYETVLFLLEIIESANFPNGGSEGTKGVFRLHHNTTFVFQRSHACETLLFLFEIIDSANSGFLIFLDPLVFTI